MSHREQDAEQEVPQKIDPEILDDLMETGPPINPILSAKVDRETKGYRYYQKIQEKLPDWWEQFNGKLNKRGGLEFGTLRDFLLTKVKRGSQEYRWLTKMLGPDQKPPRGEKRDVPWLGDWQRRRQAGFGVLDNMDKVKPLVEAIKQNLQVAESIRSLAPLHLTDVIRLERMLDQVEEAFAGRLFLPNEDPLSPRNQARFKAYNGMMKVLILLKHKISHEWIRVHGVDPFNPHEMRDMVQMAGAIGGAAMLTGFAAGQRMLPGPNGQQVVQQRFTEDALLLAEHLTEHAHTFKKPLPVIEAEVVKTEPQEAKKEKTNGKHHVV